MEFENKPKPVKRDWFNRKLSDNYTTVNNDRKTIGWDRGRDNYSSFFIDEDASMKEAAKVVSSMFNVIGVDKHVGFAKKDDIEKRNVGSNNNKIPIPLGMLQDEDGKWIDADLDTLDAFYGGSIQNAAKYGLQTQKEYEEMIKNKHDKKKTLKTVFSDILNTERLDETIGEKFPGYLKFVQKFKNHTFDKNYEPVGEDASKQEKLMDLIARMLRFPKNVTPEETAEFAEPLERIKKIAKKHKGIPETKKDCDSMATSFANIVYKYIDEEEEPPPPENGDGDGDDEEDGDGEGSPKGKAGPELSKDDIDKLAEKMESMMGDSEDMSGVTDGDVEDFEDAAEDKSDSESQMINYEKQGEASSERVTFVKSGVDKRTYMDIRLTVDFTKAHVVRKLFERKSKDYAFSMKSMRTGRLDTCKLAEAKQGVPTIYERIGHVSTNKVLVGVLVDESGSMGGNRIKKAREAVIYLNEIFRRMSDIELFIYGHNTSGHDAIVRVYKERGFQNDQHALGAISEGGANRDGDAIWAVARRIRNLNKDQGILFVISDGQPSAIGYSGQSAIDDTRKKVTMSQNLGFQVIQIAIEEGVPSKQMFDYYVKMTNISTFPTELANYMSKKVGKMIRESITL